MHGDLYAHNTLFDENANTIFGDFGAATMYDTTDKNAPYLERLDVRAFGCLMDDLLNQNKEPLNSLKQFLIQLKEECMQEDILKRPGFRDICNYFSSISLTN